MLIKKLALILLFSSTLLLSPLGAAATPPTSGRAITKESITPADSLARINLIIDELKLIAKEMGKSIDTNIPLQTAGISPREVYYASLAWREHADHLTEELSGSETHRNVDDVDEKTIRPFDVWQNVNQVYESLLSVKPLLKITEQLTEQAVDQDIKPDDVFKGISDAIHITTLLSNQRFSTEQSYQTVTQAVHSMAYILASFKGTPRIPEEPNYERFKTPADNYRALINISNKIHEIATRSKLQTGVLMLDEDADYLITEEDNFTLSNIVLSNINYLLEYRSPGAIPPQAYRPRYILPSQLNQRIRMLESQLDQLDKLSTKHPDWLPTRKVIYE